MGYGKIKIGRYREIITVFTRYGFGMFFKRFSFHPFSISRNSKSNFRDNDDNCNASAGKRLRLALESLGPTFIKLGQLLSVRQDILPADIIEELKKLQDLVHPFPFSEVKELIEAEFNDELENIYKEFDIEPLAAASISQVHRAMLFSGKQVAVKVQRPGIEEIIDLDLDILKDMAHFIDGHTKYGKIYDFSNMVEDFGDIIKSELDFTKEGENSDTLMHNLSRDKGVTVPKVKWIYTTKRILTMEYVEGIKASDLDALAQAGIDPKNIAETISTSICNQILWDGFFHADPHPGNIQILTDGTIVLLDLGMVGYLNELSKAAIVDFFIGIVYRDSQAVVNAITRMDAFTEESDITNFRKSIDILIGKYLDKPMDKIKIDELLNDIFHIAFLNHIKTPNEFAILGKTLGTLQGLIEILAPEINPIMIAEPIAKKLFYQSLSYKNVSTHIKRSLLEYHNLFNEFPAAIRNILNKTENDNFTIQFEMKETNMFPKRLERSLNRMSFSLILLAISIIIAGVLISSGFIADTSTEMYLFNAKVLKSGLLLSIIILLGLVISMVRSRR